MTAKPLTLEALKDQPTRVGAFLNYGSEGQGQIVTFMDYPRLSYLWRSYKGRALRKEGVRERITWQVDGLDCESFDVAVKRLETAPVITPADDKLLERIPTEPMELRALHAMLCGLEPDEVPRMIPRDHPIREVRLAMLRLSERGLITYHLEGLPADGDDPFPGARTKSLCSRVLDAAYTVGEA